MSDYLPGARVSDDGWFWWDGTEWVQFPAPRMDLVHAQNGTTPETTAATSDVAAAPAPDPSAAVAPPATGRSAAPPVPTVPVRELPPHGLVPVPGAGPAWTLAMLPLVVAAAVVGATFIGPYTVPLAAVAALMIVRIVSAVLVRNDATRMRQSRLATDDFGRGAAVTALFAGIGIGAYLHQRVRRGASSKTHIAAWLVTSILALASLVGAAAFTVVELVPAHLDSSTTSHTADGAAAQDSHERVTQTPDTAR